MGIEYIEPSHEELMSLVDEYIGLEWKNVLSPVDENPYVEKIELINDDGMEDLPGERMELIVVTEDVELTPEKMEEVYYDSNTGEFMVNFSTVGEVMSFIDKYGKAEITPPEEEYDYGSLRFIDDGR